MLEIFMELLRNPCILAMAMATMYLLLLAAHIGPIHSDVEDSL